MMRMMITIIVMLALVVLLKRNMCVYTLRIASILILSFFMLYLSLAKANEF